MGVILSLRQLIEEARQGGRLDDSHGPAVIRIPTFCPAADARRVGFRFMALHPELRPQVWIGVGEGEMEIGTRSSRGPDGPGGSLPRLEWEDYPPAYFASSLWEDARGEEVSPGRRRRLLGLLRHLQHDVRALGDAPRESEERRLARRYEETVMEAES